MVQFMVRRTLMAGVASAALVCASQTAWAQAAPAEPPAAQSTQAEVDENSGGLQDIFVTATRTSTNIQRTPIAVTALTTEALQERGARSLLDLNSFTPSLSVGNTSGQATSGGYAIRGMGVNGSSSAAVGIYVDDVYFSSSAGNLLRLIDVERIEVLRGPQGTLFGRNTIAGAVQFITNKPTQEFGGYVDGTVGRYDRADIQGAINLPVTRTLAVRLTGASQRKDGYVLDEFNQIYRGAERYSQIRVQGRWEPMESLTVDLKGDFFRQRSNGQAIRVTAINPNALFIGLGALGGETRPYDDRYLSRSRYSFAGFGSPEFARQKFEVYQGVVNYDVTENFHLKSITAYTKASNSTAYDTDSTPLNFVSVTPDDNTAKVFTQEFQASGSALDERLKWTTGVYYYDSRSRSQSGILSIGLDAFPLDPASRSNVESKAVYGQATFNFTEALSVTGGLRYSKETSTDFVEGTAPGSSMFKNTSPLIGINFQATERALFYAKASRGFRAGGFTADARLPGNGLGFGPETAWTYEAGARLDLFDRRLRLNPTVFQTDWKSIQFNLLIPTAGQIILATANAGDARIRGVELEGQLIATDRLSFNFAGSYLDAEYTRVPALTYSAYPEGVLGPVVTLPNLTRDTELQRTPKYKISVGGRYVLPLKGGQKITLSGDYTYTDRQRSAVTISDSVEMPSYHLVNSRLQFDSADEMWSAALFVTNLTNEYYLTGGVDYAGGFTAGARVENPARPREWGLQATVRF